MLKRFALIFLLFSFCFANAKQCENYLLSKSNMEVAFLDHYGLKGSTIEKGLDYSEYAIRSQWLHMASMVPYHQHHSLMLRILRHYIDLNKYPPLLIKDAEFIHPSEAQRCGICSSRTNGFINSFIEPLKEYYSQTPLSPQLYRAGRIGKFVLVFSGPHLLGLIKASGVDTPTQTSDGRFFLTTSNPTFLALRNVVNERGQLILAMGGVYFIGKETWSDFMTVINSQGPYENFKPDVLKEGFGNYETFARNFSVGLLNVNKLEVAPATQWAELPYTFEQVVLLRKIFDPGTTPTKRDYIEHLKSSPQYDNELAYEVNRTLDFLRASIENEIKSDSNLERMRAFLRKASQQSHDLYHIQAE